MSTQINICNYRQMFLLLLFTFMTTASVIGQIIQKNKPALIQQVTSSKRQVTAFISYYDNGKKESEWIPYDTSLIWVGERIFYNPKGILTKKFFMMGAEQIPYADIKDSTGVDDLLVDALSGLEINYHENGKIKSRGLLVYTKKIGYWHYYGADGAHINTEYFPSLDKKPEPGK